MTLPSDLQRFSHPTLVVLANHVQAKFWLAQNPDLTVIGDLREAPEKKTDNEGSFVNTNHGSVSGPEPKNDQNRLKHFLRDMATYIETRAKKYQVAHIYLAMSPDLRHQIETELSPDIKQKINRRLDADLMKDDILDVLHRLRQSV